MMRTMVHAAIQDIEAVRASLPAQQRGHSDIVLRHLRSALRDLVPAPAREMPGSAGGNVIRLDLSRRVRGRAPLPPPWR